ncbi:4Fe-4S binding protein [bacterium]|nr:4Fe-4S binding protein [bacterium]
MIRKIIHIDEAKCDGCGECVPACEEGALAIIDGKARLVSEVYCDGLGACLSECPQGAITIQEREAAEYDERATHAHLVRRRTAALLEHGGGCPGAQMRSLASPAPLRVSDAPPAASQLRTWPIQLALVPPHAPYLAGADLLLVADCVPFAYADFHRDFLCGRPVLIACPKLDNVAPYAAKLAAIFAAARPRSLSVLHMQVPCCTGIVRLAEAARAASGLHLPLRDVTISIEGEVLSERECATK